MPTKVKIKINDDVKLREQLDNEYARRSQIELCQYALLLANYILELINYEDKNDSIIKNGYAINKNWQINKARMYDVRQAAFKIHKKAKETNNIIIQTALRTVGHAISSAHMKEHAMVASDYAIKVINLLYPDDLNAVVKHRKWQIECLKSIK